MTSEYSPARLAARTRSTNACPCASAGPVLLYAGEPPTGAQLTASASPACVGDAVDLVATTLLVVVLVWLAVGLTRAIRRATRGLRSIRGLGAEAHAERLLADASLKAMVAARPGSLAELEALPGLGPKRVARFGAQLLAVLETVQEQSDE